MLTQSTPVGFVVIGRNEGERFRRCLASALRHSSSVVYVDSGSTDDSVQFAGSKGVEVVMLDMSRPFTAARARNAGFHRLLQLHPEVEFVQFLDGDTELSDQWITEASSFLGGHPQVAVVCGRLRERDPSASIYNLLCDIEWDIPSGEAQACGGNAMMRARAFLEADGFREALIAGEEPELSHRLRAAGWHIWRIDQDMAWHDAQMTRFAQWWRRAYRAGHAFAEGAHLHRHSKQRLWTTESARAWFWGMVLPAAGIAAMAFLGAPGALAFAVYPLQVVRIALRGKRSARENWWYALFTVAGKFPEALGQARFLLNRCLGTRSALIEYK
jgi:GT2 family glycosyltransferase